MYMWEGAGHLWVTASGMGRLVDMAPTRDARRGSRAAGGTAGAVAEDEGREAAAAVGRGRAVDAVGCCFGGGSCCAALMLLEYLWGGVRGGIRSPGVEDGGRHMSRCFLSAASFESMDMTRAGVGSMQRRGEGLK